MRKLIVSNFPENTTEDQLAGLFRDYAVESVVLQPGKYAVVTFAHDGEARRALREWGGWKWDERWLRVKAADW
jgi:hypothetical protein